MKLSRNLTLKIQFLFDECLPPIIRDTRWFMWLPFKILFRDKADVFFSFRENAHRMTEAEFRKVYEDVHAVTINRETDLNTGCIEEIQANLEGQNLLEAGCGNGFLAGMLSKNYGVTACDQLISEDLTKAYPKVQFQEANIESLPFTDGEFDTVICTHTLEHVQNISAALQELRRVTGKRLILVVPKQRPYKYTFDLHLHFFPYQDALLRQVGTTTGEQWIKEIQGDWFYMEDKS